MGSIIDYARTETRGFSIHPFREADALVLAQLSYDDVPECVPRLDDVESKYGTLRDRVKQFDVRRPIRSLHMLRKLPFNGVTIARADDELNHDQAVPDHDVENVGLVDPQHPKNWVEPLQCLCNCHYYNVRRMMACHVCAFVCYHCVI